MTRFLLAAAFFCAAPTWAQTAPAQPINNSLFRLVTPAQAQALSFDKPIAIHLRNTTFGAALAELQKQSGVPLGLSNLTQQALDTEMSIDVETPSLDEALRAIADEAGLKVGLQQRYDANPPRLYLKRAQDQMVVPQPDPNGPLFVNGLFLVRLRKLEVKHLGSLDWNGGQAPASLRENNLNVSLDITADARLFPLGPARWRITRAQDDLGRSLVPAPLTEAVRKPFFLDADFGGETTQTVALLPPQSDARKLAHLEGVAIYILPIAFEKWEASIALDGPKISHDFKSGGQDVRVSVESVRRNGEELDVNISILGLNSANWGELGNPLFSEGYTLSWMQIEDANGAILRPQSRNGGRGNNDMEAQATFYLPQNTGRIYDNNIPPSAKLALPLKFVFDAPTEFVQTEVPFAFENLPLP